LYIDESASGEDDDLISGARLPTTGFQQFGDRNRPDPPSIGL